MNRTAETPATPPADITAALAARHLDDLADAAGRVREAAGLPARGA